MELNHSSESMKKPWTLSTIHRDLENKIQDLEPGLQRTLELGHHHPTTRKLNLADDFVSKVSPNLISYRDGLVSELVASCRHGLSKTDIKATVLGRIKATQSIQNSLRRREQGRQKSFTDLKEVFYEIHDLAGILIAVQSGDVGRANNFVSQSFRAIKKANHWTEDRPVGQFWNSRLGSYDGFDRHVSMRGDREDCNVIFEVEVTTVKDFVYNQYAHDWLYKGYNGRLTEKDETVMDIIHGASTLVDMGGEYLMRREKENCDSFHQIIVIIPLSRAASAL